MYRAIVSGLILFAVLFVLSSIAPSLAKRNVVSERIVEAVIIKIEEDMDPNFHLTVNYNGLVSRVDAVGHFKLGEKIKTCLVEERLKDHKTKYFLARHSIYCNN